MNAAALKCFLISLLSILILSACGALEENKNDPNQNPTPVGPNWSVNDVSVTCENEALCPDNQGILLVVKRHNEYSSWGTTSTLLVYRCTGTIYDIDKVVTAGHCVDDFSGASEIWFKTVDKPGKPARTFKVSSNSIAKQSPPSSDLNRIDYGAFRLEGQATGIAYGHPALAIPADTHEMIALVINPKPTSKTIATEFILNAVPCRHGANMIDPISYEQNPDKFLFTDCKIYGGNSGGAVVSRRDPLSILGLISTSNSAEHAKPSSLNSPPVELAAEGEDDNAPITDRGTATNARCFTMPAWPQMAAKCIEISSAVIEKARTQAIKEVVKKTTVSIIQKWFTDFQSNTVLAKSGIHFFPLLTTLTNSPSFLERNKREGLGLIPSPVCVDKDLAMDLDAIIYPPAYSIFPPSERSLNPPLKAVAANLSLSMHIHREKNGQYTFRYTPSWRYSSLGYALSSSQEIYRELTSMSGMTKSLPKCNGDEDKTFMDVIRTTEDL